MALTRRSTVVGIGTLLVGGGVIIGSGAFTGNTNRSVSVEFADDSNAYLGMKPVKREDNDNIRVTEGGDGVIGIVIKKANANSRTVLGDLVAFTNNNPRDVTEMTITIDDLSQNADVSVTSVPDGIPSGESVTGLGLIIDTTDYTGEPKLNATINIRTVLAAEEDS